ncbi:MAG: LysR family transcriptional regulator [Rhodospirillaceae bacterium]|nr:LysR family transcriptional regulator [Rhodospirillaceae bacterium]
MNIELHHLRYFVAVAEDLHFRRAAERLHIAQPALSRAIKWLESEIGAVLLLRTTRNVALTEAGRIFLHETRLALTQIERAQTLAQSAAAGEAGRLSVAYMDFAINGPLPAILGAFRANHPGVTIDLDHMWTERQREAIVAGDIDIGFLIGPFTAPGIDSRTILSERFVAVLPEAHPLAAKRRINLADLSDQPFILGASAYWGPYRRLVDELCLGAGFTPRVVQEAHNSDGIFGLVAAGMGVSIYVEGARNFSLRGCTIRPFKGLDANIETTAVWRADNPSPVIANFIEAVAAYRG